VCVCVSVCVCVCVSVCVHVCWTLGLSQSISLGYLIFANNFCTLTKGYGLHQVYKFIAKCIYSLGCFFRGRGGGKQVPGRDPEQRESGKTVLYPLIIIYILMSYIIIYYY
jgi:hypothetical protein